MLPCQLSVGCRWVFVFNVGTLVVYLLFLVMVFACLYVGVFKISYKFSKIVIECIYIMYNIAM